MTPAQHRQALAAGLSQKDIDDQDAEDEAFCRAAQRPVRPVVHRCAGRAPRPLAPDPCRNCLRRTMTASATAATMAPPDFVGGACPMRIQA
jgi:hypothetical protein